MALPGSVITPTAPTATTTPSPRVENPSRNETSARVLPGATTATPPTRTPVADRLPASGADDLVIHLGELRPALMRAARMFAEAVMIPTLLLMILLHTSGLVAGMSAVIGWSALTISVRWLTGRRLPGTLLLAVGVMCGRAAISLALSSALIYLVQPIIGSALMALLFLGSAALGRPITIRLARDFVALPAHLFHSPAVRRMFAQVAIVWGASRLVDVAMSLGFLRWGVEAGLLSRGVFSAALTVLTVIACTAWGWRSLRRIPGIRLRLGAAPVPAG